MPSASAQSNARPAGEHGQWELQAELQGKPRPTAAYAGPSPSSAAGQVCAPAPLPAEPSAAKELKKGRLQSTAGREPSPELPRAVPPLSGGAHSEHPHSLQIVSLAPLPNPRLIGPWPGFSYTKQVLALPGLQGLRLRPRFPHSPRLCPHPLPPRGEPHSHSFQGLCFCSHPNAYSKLLHLRGDGDTGGRVCA